MGTTSIAINQIKFLVSSILPILIFLILRLFAFSVMGASSRWNDLPDHCCDTHWLIKCEWCCNNFKVCFFSAINCIFMSSPIGHKISHIAKLSIFDIPVEVTRRDSCGEWFAGAGIEEETGSTGTGDCITSSGAAEPYKFWLGDNIFMNVLIWFYNFINPFSLYRGVTGNSTSLCSKNRRRRRW